MSFDTPSSSSSSSSGGSSTPRLTAEDDCALSPASPIIVDLVEYTQTGGSLIIPQSLSEHWTAHSIPILLNVYYTLDFLHDTYKKSSPQGPLLWATHLFARTYITNLRYPTAIDNGSVEQTDKELGTYLGKTLSSVSEALKTPDGPMRDDVLATVWILANYEVGSTSHLTVMLSYSRLHSFLWAQSTASHLRAPGIFTRMGYTAFSNREAQLLCRKQAAEWASGLPTIWWQVILGLTINRLLTTRQQVRCLLTSLECPPESKGWFKAIRETLHPGEDLAVEVGEYICKMAHVQKRILDILRARNFDAAATEYYDLVGIIFKAEDHFTTFDASYHFVDEVFNPYLRNMLNSARLKGYHVILTFANFLSNHPTTPVHADELRVLRAHCVWRVRDSAKGVMEATRRHLDPASFRNNPSPRTVFDALKLIWPLTAVYLVPSTLPEQSEAAGESLQFIGRELGVRQGLKVNRGESKLPPEAETPSKLVEDETFDPLPQSRGIM